MTYRLFIDDERFPSDWTDVVIARNSFDAIQYVINRGMPSELLFDHDLGGDDTTRTFIRWLESELLDESIILPAGFKYSVHSQNPIGAKWIRDMMEDLIYNFSEQ